MKVKAICDICSKPLNEERIKLKISHTRRYKLLALHQGETYTTKCKYDLCYDCFSKMMNGIRSLTNMKKVKEIITRLSIEDISKEDKEPFEFSLSSTKSENDTNVGDYLMLYQYGFSDLLLNGNKRLTRVKRPIAYGICISVENQSDTSEDIRLVYSMMKCDFIPSWAPLLDDNKDYSQDILEIKNYLEEEA